MSRIAKYPVAVPDKVEVSLTASEITVKGPLGTLKQRLEPRVTVKKEGDRITFAAADETKESDAMSGTMRRSTPSVCTAAFADPRSSGTE